MSFFDPLHQYPIPRGTPSAGALNTRGCENSAIFDWNRRLSREWYNFDDLERTLTRCFRVTEYLQVEYLKTVRFRDKVTKEH